MSPSAVRSRIVNNNQKSIIGILGGGDGFRIISVVDAAVAAATEIPFLMIDWPLVRFSFL